MSFQTWQFCDKCYSAKRLQNIYLKRQQSVVERALLTQFAVDAEQVNWDKNYIAVANSNDQAMSIVDAELSCGIKLGRQIWADLSFFCCTSCSIFPLLWFS